MSVLCFASFTHFSVIQSRVKIKRLSFYLLLKFESSFLFIFSMKLIMNC